MPIIFLIKYVRLIVEQLSGFSKYFLSFYRRPKKSGAIPPNDKIATKNKNLKNFSHNAVGLWIRLMDEYMAIRTTIVAK